MFNVLPKKLKDQIKKQYNLRRFIVTLNFIIFIQIFILVAFLPSWFVSFYKQRDVSSEVAKAQDDLLVNEVSKLSVEINSINKKLEVIKTTQTGFSPTQILDDIVEQKSSSISINEITYIKSGANEVQVTLGGTARERDSLLSFVRKLEASKLFSKVDSPISNYTKDRDINFSLFLNMKI